MNKTRHIVITALLAIIAITAQAQCKFRNTAFSSGEFLTYNLYYNWQFIWVKAGNASLSTIRLQGQACLSRQPHYPGKREGGWHVHLA